MDKKGNPVSFLTLATIIVTNAVPLIGVLTGIWDGIAVIILYLLETIIIGLVHALRLFAYSKFHSIGFVVSLLITLFFTFHYGMFVFVQSVLFFGLAKEVYPEFTDGFNVIHNYGLFFQKPYLIAIYTFFLGQIIYTIQEVTSKKENQKFSISEYMFIPYTRIFIQQFVVILGAFIMLLFNSVTGVVVLLVILKTLVEYLSVKYGSMWLKPKSVKR